MKIIALFDFCDTIVRTQTVGQFCRGYLREQKRLPKTLILFYKIINQLSYYCRRKGIWFRLLRGASLNQLNDFSMAFSKKLYENFLIQEIGERIRWHQQQGHMIYIVSAGLSFYVSEVARKLGIEHVIATELEIKDQRLTGRLGEKGMCYGEKKVDQLMQYLSPAECSAIDWESSYAYTDHVSDLPMLNLVGNPFIVIQKNKKIRFLNSSVYHAIQFFRFE